MSDKLVDFNSLALPATQKGALANFDPGSVPRNKFLGECYKYNNNGNFIQEKLVRPGTDKFDIELSANNSFMFVDIVPKERNKDIEISAFPLSDFVVDATDYAATGVGTAETPDDFFQMATVRNHDNKRADGAIHVGGNHIPLGESFGWQLPSIWENGDTQLPGTTRSEIQQDYALVRVTEKGKGNKYYFIHTATRRLKPGVIIEGVGTIDKGNINAREVLAAYANEVTSAQIAGLMENARANRERVFDVNAEILLTASNENQSEGVAEMVKSVRSSQEAAKALQINEHVLSIEPVISNNVDKNGLQRIGMLSAMELRRYYPEWEQAEQPARKIAETIATQIVLSQGKTKLTGISGLGKLVEISQMAGSPRPELPADAENWDTVLIDNMLAGHTVTRIPKGRGSDLGGILIMDPKYPGLVYQVNDLGSQFADTHGKVENSRYKVSVRCIPPETIMQRVNELRRRKEETRAGQRITRELLQLPALAESGSGEEAGEQANFIIAADKMTGEDLPFMVHERSKTISIHESATVLVNGRRVENTEVRPPAVIGYLDPKTGDQKLNIFFAVGQRPMCATSLTEEQLVRIVEIVRRDNPDEAEQLEQSLRGLLPAVELTGERLEERWEAFAKANNLSQLLEEAQERTAVTEHWAKMLAEKLNMRDKHRKDITTQTITKHVPQEDIDQRRLPLDNMHKFRQHYLPYNILSQNRVIRQATRFQIGRGTDLGRMNSALLGGGNEELSRIHAELYVWGNVMKVMDLGSTNGTYINGKRLEPNKRYALEDGDQIRLGSEIFYAVAGCLVPEKSYKTLKANEPEYGTQEIKVDEFEMRVKQVYREMDALDEAEQNGKQAGWRLGEAAATNRFTESLSRLFTEIGQLPVGITISSKSIREQILQKLKQLVK